jgi:transcription-repair coupling factor (superfamily II helicase)
VELSEGQALPPEELMELLLQNGYERVAMVEGCGQCAMRGSILDVFPPNEPHALRIEYFDIEVDSIRRFDCISQRSIERVKSVRLAPATECLINDREAAAERLRQAIEEGADLPETLSLLPEVQDIAPVQAEDELLPSLESFFVTLDAMELTPEELEAVNGGIGIRRGRKKFGWRNVYVVYNANGDEIGWRSTRERAVELQSANPGSKVVERELLLAVG